MRRLYAFACFNSLLCTVLCCNPEWFPYKQKCYRSVKFPYDIRLARRYCQIFRGDLATIHTEDTLQAIAASILTDSNNSFWMNENSTIGDPASSNSCSYLTHVPEEKIEVGVGDCAEEKYFICEVPDEDKDFVCPTSWSLYGNTCYKTFKNKAAYTQAVTFCALQRAQLAVLDDIAKEHNAAAVIIGLKEPYLMAAKADDANAEEVVYKWSNGHLFSPSCTECRNNTEGDCIGFSSDPQHPTLFTWVNLNCNGSNFYMCEMSPQIERTTTPTIAPTTVSTTTLAPLQCPVGYNWKAHEESGFCFWETTYESERLNWFQARQFCQVYGGDLATYRDTNQENHGLGGAKGHYSGLWFGLERSKEDEFHWIDGSSLNYTNWRYNEPNLKSRTKFCVMHGSSNSEWELDYCGVKRWFICKAPKSREPKSFDVDLFQKTKCNFSGPSIYRTHWYLHDNYCYLVHDSAKYSWDTAKYFCQDNGGHMASIHSTEETDFILRLTPNTPSTDYWMGLSARGLDSSLTWSDGTPLNYIYWADDFNETKSIDNCVTFDKRRGSWKSDHCNRFLGVICKRGVNASYDFPTPEPTSSLPGNCEKEWYRFGNKCLKSFGGKWSQRQAWIDAVDKCKKLGATLLSIHNNEEQDFVTDILLDLGTSSWIGLENIDRGSVFKWNDDTPLDYTNWNSNEPTFSGDSDDSSEYGLRVPVLSRLCVTLDFDSTSMGKWSDNACHQRNAYICQKTPNRTLLEPPPDPFACSNISGWSRLGPSCYAIFEEGGQRLPWVDAQAKCRTFDANLVTFQSSAATLFLIRKIKAKDQPYWIGIRETVPNTYHSVAKRRDTINFNWLASQPQRVSDTDNCVSINSDGKGIVRNCKEAHPFICELSFEKEEPAVTEVEKIQRCPTAANWVDLGDRQCFYFGLRRVSWTDALFLCHRQGGHLASFHSMQEMKLVKEHLLGFSEESSFHIGLGKKNDGSYGWVDHSALDFTFWEDGHPSSTIMSCVQLHPSTAKWRPVGCDDMLRNYICSYPLKSLGNEESGARNATAIKQPPEEQVMKSNLSAGAVVSIVVCLSLILLVIGGAVYRMYPRSNMKPSLLETDGL